MDTSEFYSFISTFDARRNINSNLKDVEKINRFVQNALKGSQDPEFIKRICSFIVSHLWSLQLEPKLARRFIKILVDIEKHNPDDVYAFLAPAMCFSKTQKIDNKDALSICSQLIDTCETARKIITSQLDDFLLLLSDRLHELVFQQTVWIQETQDTLHTCCKVILQVMQHLSNVMEKLVWGSITTHNVKTTQLLGSVFTQLFAMLVDSSVPREARIFAGTITGFLFSLCPNKTKVFEAVNTLYIWLGTVETTLIQIGNLQVDTKEICSRTNAEKDASKLHVGHLFLLSGFLSCASDEYLSNEMPVSMVFETDSEKDPSKSQSFMMFCFTVLCQLCSMEEHKHLAFKALCLWYQKLHKNPNLYTDSLDLDYSGLIVRGTLHLVWRHSDSPQDGVSESAIEILKLLIDVHQNMSGQRKEATSTENVDQPKFPQASTGKGDRQTELSPAKDSTVTEEQRIHMENAKSKNEECTRKEKVMEQEMDTVDIENLSDIEDTGDIEKSAIDFESVEDGEYIKNSEDLGDSDNTDTAAQLESLWASAGSDKVASGSDIPSDISAELQSLNIATEIKEQSENKNMALCEDKSKRDIESESDGNFAHVVMRDVMQMSWQVKGKHYLCSALLDNVDIQQWLSRHPATWTELLACMAVHSMASATTEVYKAILTQVRKLSNTDLMKSCLSWLAKGMTSQDSVIVYNVCHLWLPWTLKLDDQAYKIVLSLLQTKDGAFTAERSLRAQIALFRAARAVHIVQFQDLCQDVVLQAALHPDDDLRLDGLALVCNSAKKAEQLSDSELHLLNTALPYNMNIDCPPFRIQLQAHIRAAIARVRDGAFVMLKQVQGKGPNKKAKKAKQGQGQEGGVRLEEELIEQIDFIDWLWNLCLENLHPGSSFQRLKTCLEWMWVILDSTIYQSERTQKKGGCPEHAVQVLVYARSHGRWQFFTSDASHSLLACILDGTDEIREFSSRVLLQFFPWPLPLSDKKTAEPGDETRNSVEKCDTTTSASQNVVLNLLEKALKLCACPKAHNADSGAILCKLVFDKYVVENQWYFHNNNTDTLTVDVGSGTSTELRAFDFLDILLKRLEHGVALAKENALQAARGNPAHGLPLVSSCVFLDSKNKDNT